MAACRLTAAEYARFKQSCAAAGKTPTRRLREFCIGSTPSKNGTRHEARLETEEIVLQLADPLAQPLLWQYSRGLRAISPALADDLQAALRENGYDPLEHGQVVFKIANGRVINVDSEPNVRSSHRQRKRARSATGPT